MSEKFLVIDAETGGIDPRNNSLLSIAGVLWEARKTPIPLFSFFVKEPEVFTTPEALAVNKIDLEDITKFGYSPRKCIDTIRSSTLEHFPFRKRITLAGHNVQFDIAFLKRIYDMEGEDISKDFNSRILDTSSVISFLRNSGHIKGGSSKSDFLFDFCEIEFAENERHTALGDAYATAKALNVLIERFGINNE